MGNELRDDMKVTRQRFPVALADFERNFYAFGNILHAVRQIAGVPEYALVARNIIFDEAVASGLKPKCDCAGVNFFTH